MDCERCKELEAERDKAQMDYVNEAEISHELEKKLREAILTYSPYVKALKEAVAKLEAENERMRQR